MFGMFQSFARMCTAAVTSLIGPAAVPPPPRDCMLQRALGHLRLESSSPGATTRSDSLIRVAIISPRLARKIQTLARMLKHGLLHSEMQILLHPAFRKNLKQDVTLLGKSTTIKFIASDRASVDEPDQLQDFFSLVRNETAPRDGRPASAFIEKLTLEVDKHYSRLLMQNRTLRLSSVFPTMSLVRLHVRYSGDELYKYNIYVDENDIQTLSAATRLCELRLSHNYPLSIEAFDSLFQPQSGSLPPIFFPVMDRLSAVVLLDSYPQILAAASSSAIAKQLVEFDVRIYNDHYVKPSILVAPPSDAMMDVDVVAVNAALKRLSALRIVGKSFLLSERVSSIDGAIDWSPLSECVKVGETFLGRADLNNLQLDLTAMSALQEIGDEFLVRAKNVGGLRLPGTVKRIGKAFACQVDISELDLSSLRGLESINVDCFAMGSTIKSFDTTSFAGKIPACSHASFFLAHCAQLVKVDVSGFRGVTRIGGRFLMACKCLKSIDGMGGLSDVVEIEELFLALTSSLETCDLAAMKSLVSTGRGFLQGSKMDDDDSVNTFFVQLHKKTNKRVEREESETDTETAEGEESETATETSEGEESETDI